MTDSIAPSRDLVSDLRRLRAADRLRAIGERLRRGDSDDFAALAPLLLELAARPAYHAASTPVRGMRRALARVRAGADPYAIADLALYEIARHWSAWSADARREALVVGAERWAALAPALASSEEPREAANLATLIAEAADPALYPTLNHLLLHPAREVSSAAERAWIDLARRASTEGTPLPGLRHALADAASAFPEHRARGVLHALVLLVDGATLRFARDPESDDPLAALARDRDHPGNSALRGFLRASKLPLAGERAWLYLAFSPLARAAGDRLAAANGAEELDRLLRHAALGLHPARARRLAEITLRVERIDASRSIVTRRQLPRLMSWTKAGAAPRAVACDGLLIDPDAIARNALARFGSMRDRADLCFDADPRVARGAMLRASLAGARGGRVASEAASEEERRLVHLCRAPDETIRDWAKHERALSASLTHAGLGARLAARRARNADPSAFRRTIVGMLGANNAEAKQTALRIIHALEASDEFAPELIALAMPDAAPDVRVLATLASVLGGLRQTPADDALARLARHADPRVRANAVQAIDLAARRGSAASYTPAPVFLELTRDPHHRVRANALRAIIAGGVDAAAGGLPTAPLDAHTPNAIVHDALDDLAAMLTDDRPSHRLAGLWLAGRTISGPAHVRLGSRRAEMAARLVEIARFDPDAAVRFRAASGADRLRCELRSKWRNPNPIGGRMPVAEAA